MTRAQKIALACAALVASTSVSAAAVVLTRDGGRGTQGEPVQAPAAAEGESSTAVAEAVEDGPTEACADCGTGANAESEGATGTTGSAETSRSAKAKRANKPKKARSVNQPPQIGVLLEQVESHSELPPGAQTQPTASE